MTTIDNTQLKAFLEDTNIVDQKELAKAYKTTLETGKDLGDILLKKKLINEEQLVELEAYIMGIPFVDLSKEKIPKPVLKIIPEPIARKNNVVAFNKNGDKLEVAMTNPRDLQTIDFIRKKSDLDVLPRLTTKESIEHVLKQYEESLEKEFEGLIDGEEETSEEGVTVEQVEEGDINIAPEDLEKEAQELPIIRIVDSILKHAITQDASDIHIEPEENDVLVRYRIDGILHDAMTLPKQVQSGIAARIKILSNLRLDEHRLPQDGRFTIKTEDYKVSFRVSLLPVFDGEKIVMRLLHEDSKGLTLEQLGFRNDDLERIQGAIHKPLGLILVTGPTGSGKTTALYTAMDIINKPDKNISTVEDPIEYRMPRINQTQVNPEIGFTFASGLRALVRQDPDVIMVGEIRDEETASLAVNAALTGHLVLSTLHTNSAAGALPRLMDMGQEPFLIASTVILIEAQRLIRTLCPDTKQKYNLSKKEIDSLGKEIDLERVLGLMKKYKVVGKSATWETIDFYKPVPSDNCPDGYKGREGIHETLEISETIKSLITKNATSDEIEKQAKKEGMITMLENGIMKAAEGLTTIEEILRVTRE
ncbi:MAG: ATPase, T2SS/T4P/T4SS family [Candidatus Spechtbacterales bacterium]|nr:ATPase, T2SS/T4P/T4SS family [Candidatus Spechtbacterales bacterium]